MLLFEIASETYSLYTGWDELPLENYIRYQELQCKVPKGGARLVKWNWEIFRCLSNVPEKYRNRISLADVGGMVNLALAELAGKEIFTEPLERFTFRETEYVTALSRRNKEGLLIPLHDLTVEEGLDAYELMQTHEAGQPIALVKLTALLAVIFRPQGEPYEEDKVHERAELFRQLPTQTAMAAYFFLLSLWSSYTGTTPSFLKADLPAPGNSAITN